jgi:membrane-bound lytic murein transglycosylase A
VTVPDLATPEGAPFRRLMIAQDVGSAIRGKERGDIYWGTGEAAGAIAGSTRHKAQFHVLLPKR